MTRTFDRPTAAVTALEVELVRIRDAKSTLLDVEMRERYASRDPEAEAEMTRDATSARTSQRDAEEKLVALVARLRIEDPGAIASWVERHVALLEEVIAAHANAEAGSREQVTLGVAEEERAAWREVLAGRRTHVEENVFYVPRPRERVRELFGVAADRW